VSAQAFMQAFYPPYTLGNGTGSTLSNNAYIETPLNGYQYPLIETFSANDPALIYLSGESNCVNYDIVEESYYESANYVVTSGVSQGLYTTVGQSFLQNVLPANAWSFGNAYSIYDYLSYENNHNSTVAQMLSSDSWSNTLPTLYSLASTKQFDLHGNLSASGAYANDRILAISGQTLAAKILGQLYLNIAANGTVNKFNLIVGDFEPMLALFALLSLPAHDSNFKLIPSFGSALVFELFSWENGTSASNPDGATYPSQRDLWVRFYFRNSTGDGSTNSSNGLQSYPIFNRGPSVTDIQWLDFESEMNSIMLSNIGDWCAHCGSSAVWCPAFATSSGSSGGGSFKSSNMTPQVAGVIGAGVTIGVFAILVAAAMLFGGLRFHRREPASKRQSSLGGFKGSQKLASDTDLHIPKNAAPVGVAIAPIGVDEESKKGHERVGSWEMKSPSSPSSPTDDKAIEEGRFSSLTGSTAAAVRSSRGTGVTRPSFEEDDSRHEEEVDRIGFSHPVQPDDRV
jgi:hypothetical protein